MSADLVTHHRLCQVRPMELCQCGSCSLQGRVGRSTSAANFSEKAPHAAPVAVSLLPSLRVRFVWSRLGSAEPANLFPKFPHVSGTEGASLLPYY